MRLGMIPDTPAEREALDAGLVPVPMLETQLAFTLAQVVMVATRLGVFDELAKTGACTADEIARRCGTDPQATVKLLLALAGSGYLRTGHKTFELTALARTWLVRDSPRSLADKLVFQFHEWDLMTQSEQYVRTGRSLDFHDQLADEQWDVYQRGMRAMATAPAEEIAQVLAVPAAARTLLDIGGSHGYYSVALCRRHRDLHAVVLDLPDAVRHAAPLLAAEQMGDRVSHRAGDALREDLGTAAYDVVLLVSVAHHLTAEQNRDLAGSVARALRPGGVFAVIEPFRTGLASEISQVGTLAEFYFGLTSRAGTWSAGEIAAWQRDAGLQPAPPTALRSAPFGIQSATK